MMEKAFECLIKAGLKIKLSKCSFFKEQIHYICKGADMIVWLLVIL